MDCSFVMNKYFCLICSVIRQGYLFGEWKDWTTLSSLFNESRWRKIAQNEGKKFENDIKSSVPDTCWIYRLRDNASSFANGTNTRFTSSNICDYILFDDITRTLFLIECKSTKGTSVPLTMIRNGQIQGLQEASKHDLVTGILVNFRNENNDTFFILINEFVDMMDSINKKSFNIKDLDNIGAIRIKSGKKRTRYKYDIQDMINKLHLWGDSIWTTTKT